MTSHYVFTERFYLAVALLTVLTAINVAINVVNWNRRHRKPRPGPGQNL